MNMSSERQAMSIDVETDRQHLSDRLLKNNIQLDNCATDLQASLISDIVLPSGDYVNESKLSENITPQINDLEKEPYLDNMSVSRNIQKFEKLLLQYRQNYDNEEMDNYREIRPPPRNKKSLQSKLISSEFEVNRTIRKSHSLMENLHISIDEKEFAINYSKQEEQIKNSKDSNEIVYEKETRKSNLTSTPRKSGKYLLEHEFPASFAGHIPQRPERRSLEDRKATHNHSISQETISCKQKNVVLSESSIQNAVLPASLMSNIPRHRNIIKNSDSFIDILSNKELQAPDKPPRKKSILHDPISGPEEYVNWIDNREKHRAVFSNPTISDVKYQSELLIDCPIRRASVVLLDSPHSCRKSKHSLVKKADSIAALTEHEHSRRNSQNVRRGLIKHPKKIKTMRKRINQIFKNNREVPSCWPKVFKRKKLKRLGSIQFVKRTVMEPSHSTESFASIFLSTEKNSSFTLPELWKRDEVVGHIFTTEISESVEFPVHVSRKCNNDTRPKPRTLRERLLSPKRLLSKESTSSLDSQALKKAYAFLENNFWSTNSNDESRKKKKSQPPSGINNSESAENTEKAQVINSILPEPKKFERTISDDSTMPAHEGSRKLSLKTKFFLHASSIPDMAPLILKAFSKQSNLKENNTHTKQATATNCKKSESKYPKRLKREDTLFNISSLFTPVSIEEHIDEYKEISNLGVQTNSETVLKSCVVDKSFKIDRTTLKNIEEKLKTKNNFIDEVIVHVDSKDSYFPKQANLGESDNEQSPHIKNITYDTSQNSSTLLTIVGQIQSDLTTEDIKDCEIYKHTPNAEISVTIENNVSEDTPQTEQKLIVVLQPTSVTSINNENNFENSMELPNEISGNSYPDFYQLKSIEPYESNPSIIHKSIGDSNIDQSLSNSSSIKNPPQTAYMPHKTDSQLPESNELCAKFITLQENENNDLICDGENDLTVSAATKQFAINISTINNSDASSSEKPLNTSYNLSTERCVDTGRTLISYNGSIGGENHKIDLVEVDNVKKFVTDRKCNQACSSIENSKLCSRWSGKQSINISANIESAYCHDCVLDLDVPTIALNSETLSEDVFLSEQLHQEIAKELELIKLNKFNDANFKNRYNSSMLQVSDRRRIRANSIPESDFEFDDESEETPELRDLKEMIIECQQNLQGKKKGEALRNDMPRCSVSSKMKNSDNILRVDDKDDFFDFFRDRPHEEHYAHILESDSDNEEECALVAIDYLFNARRSSTDLHDRKMSVETGSFALSDTSSRRNSIFIEPIEKIENDIFHYLELDADTAEVNANFKQCKEVENYFETNIEEDALQKNKLDDSPLVFGFPGEIILKEINQSSSKATFDTDDAILITPSSICAANIMHTEPTLINACKAKFNETENNQNQSVEENDFLEKKTTESLCENSIITHSESLEILEASKNDQYPKIYSEFEGEKIASLDGNQKTSDNHIINSNMMLSTEELSEESQNACNSSTKRNNAVSSTQKPPPKPKRAFTSVVSPLIYENRQNQVSSSLMVTLSSTEDPFEYFKEVEDSNNCVQELTSYDKEKTQEKVNLNIPSYKESTHSQHSNLSQSIVSKNKSCSTESRLFTVKTVRCSLSDARSTKEAAVSFQSIFNNAHKQRIDLTTIGRRFRVNSFLQSSLCQSVDSNLNLIKGNRTLLDGAHVGVNSLSASDEILNTFDENYNSNTKLPSYCHARKELFPCLSVSDFTSLANYYPEQSSINKSSIILQTWLQRQNKIENEKYSKSTSNIFDIVKKCSVVRSGSLLLNTIEGIFVCGARNDRKYTYLIYIFYLQRCSIVK